MFDRFINWHLETKKPLVIACYITFLLMIIFIWISIQKEIWVKDINEIGDSLAGMIGSLGFVWLIITVLIQNQELINQVKELRESKDALKAQSQSLESAELFTALEYLDKKLPEFDQQLEEIKKIINNEIQTFLSNYPSDRMEHISFKPELDICEIWGYFIKEGRLEEISLIYSEDSVKEEFDYTAYLKLETINRNMGYAIKFLDSLTDNARAEIKSLISKRIENYEVSRNIDWYRYWHEILTAIEKPIRSKIARNKLAPSKIANFFIQELVNREEDKNLSN
ncbi:hypothetical protein [Acinetobacter sp.]|uniref:hypothetical protein n=1 Tax=Acinetobacter sp. TaxID=472 RepID=UPI0028AA058F|nr:hypothetical protein [Acinetobacter sp.]